jgi:hypothetical protein
VVHKQYTTQPNWQVPSTPVLHDRHKVVFYFSKHAYGSKRSKEGTQNEHETIAIYPANC